MKKLLKNYLIIIVLGVALPSCKGSICLQYLNDENLIGYYKTDYIPDSSPYYSDLNLSLDSTYVLRMLAINYAPLDTVVTNYYTGKWIKKGNILKLTHTDIALNYVDSVFNSISDTIVNLRIEDNIFHKFRIIQKDTKCRINCIDQLLFRKAFDY